VFRIFFACGSKSLLQTRSQTCVLRVPIIKW